VADEKAEPRAAAPFLAVRVLTAAAAGLAAGAVTSLLQKYLGAPWLSLVNSASPWLTVMFAAGALWPGPRGAALAGAATGLLELAGYYLTAAARGYSAGHGIVVFWAACAVIGGPLFGAAGWAWWRARGRLSRLGAAAVPTAFLAEAAVGYAWRLHYWSSALLFTIVAVVVFVLAGLRGHQHARLVLWVLALLPAGLAAELVLGLAYNQSF
jgi:Family of unknown function (DUF6518)